MKSPFTGKEMKLTTEKRTVNFRKQDIEYINLSYFCEQSNESFVTTELEELNLKQIHNKYRELNGIPFPEEIKNLRGRYGLSAAKMSELFGFGPNQYALYENGEIPSLSNAKAINLATDAGVFKKMIEENRSVLKEKNYNDVMVRIKKQLWENESAFQIENYLLGDDHPTAFTGYKSPDFKKLANMVAYFSEHIKPQKMVLNKLLFYADFCHYKKHASSISGCRYAAISHGPVPDKFRSIFEKIENDKWVDIKYIEYPDGKVGEQFLSRSSFDEVLFVDEEKDTLDTVCSFFKDKSTQRVVDISHKETAWLNNRENKSLINYEEAFDLNLF